MDKDRPLPIRKGVYILPNLLTTGSLFSAFLGLIWAIQGQYESCAIAIFASALLDGLDGKVARLTNTSSEFGVQYDSLADLAAFGVTPAILLYQWQLADYGRLGLVACFLFAACGALRLARFNIQSATSSKRFFVGLPIPAAGCTFAALVLFSGHLPEVVQTSVLPVTCLILAYILSFLMVSRVRYASFKEGGLLKALPFNSLVTALLLFVLVASRPGMFGFPLFAIYLVSGPIYTYLILPRRHPKLIRESM